MQKDKILKYVKSANLQCGRVVVGSSGTCIDRYLTKRRSIFLR